MFRWLSRYVKQINIFGIGIELREIPEAEALAVLGQQSQENAALPTPASTAPSSTPPVGPATAESAAAGTAAESAPKKESAAPLIRRENFVRVAGVSPSSRRVPRELDLMVDGDELQVHIHQPDAWQRPMWVRRDALQAALDDVRRTGGGSGGVKLPARTTRAAAEVAVVWDDSEEVEVQAGWWIWVARGDLAAALAELGVRAAWDGGE